MQFLRWGGLSPVIQRGYDKAMPTFHAPPAKKGFYAFPLGLVEPFLLSGTDPARPNNHKKEGCRHFRHTGEIWHHLANAAGLKNARLQRGTWLLTSIQAYEEALRKEIHLLRSKGHIRIGTQPECQKNFCVSTSRGSTRDHLEVFIEKIENS